jgi:hypothetical protein
MKRCIPLFDAVFLIEDNTVHSTTLQKKVIYRVFIWLSLIFSVYILIRISPTLSKPKYLPSDDFVPYWASGRLNIYGDNPFDPQKTEQLQISVGGESSGAYTISIMLNPPWAITLVMPFGFLNYSVSRFWWLIYSILLIFASSLLLWRIFSGNPKQRWLALLVVFMFAPTISVLEVGQIAPLLLLGLTGFLYFTVVERNDWLAGVFLSLASIKPQVAYLFWVALLFWIIQERRWFVVLSTSISVMLLSFIAWLFNPHIFQQYFGMLQTYQISDWANPTIGAYLRFFWFGIDKFWLQFLPSIIGCIWFIYYWYKHHSSWDWVDELPLLLIISQITSSYTWTYDLVILIPAIIQATVWISSDWKRWSTLFLAIYYMIINILDLILHRTLSDFWFIWIAPALLILYLLIRWQYTKQIDKYSPMVPGFQ